MRSVGTLWTVENLTLITQVLPLAAWCAQCPHQLKYSLSWHSCVHDYMYNVFSINCASCSWIVGLKSHKDTAWKQRCTLFQIIVIIISLSAAVIIHQQIASEYNPGSTWFSKMPAGIESRRHVMWLNIWRCMTWLNRWRRLLFTVTLHSRCLQQYPLFGTWYTTMTLKMCSKVTARNTNEHKNLLRNSLESICWSSNFKFGVKIQLR